VKVNSPEWNKCIEFVWSIASAKQSASGRRPKGEHNCKIAIRYWAMYGAGLTPARIIPAIQEYNPKQSDGNIRRIARRYRKKALRAIDLQMIGDDDLKALRKRLKKHKKKP
jgi:hypothetical protein